MLLQRSLYIAAAFLLGGIVSGCGTTQHTLPAGVPGRAPSSFDNGCVSGGPVPVPDVSAPPVVVVGQPSTGLAVTPDNCASPPPAADTIGVDVPVTQSTNATVLAGDLGSAWVVKAAAKTYFFQPGSTLSYANGELIVRSYNSLFVLPIANVQQMRQLSESSTTSHAPTSLAAESNQSLLTALANALPMAHPPGACADCAFPVALNYGTDQPFGTEPVQGQPPNTISASNAMNASPCGPDQCAGAFPTLTVASDASTPSATLTTGPAACFPSTYVFEVEAGACAPPQGISLSSTKRRTSVVATRDDYRWGFWNRRTVLQCTWGGYPVPASAIYEYVDLYGYYSGPNYGHFLAPNPQNIQFRYAPTYTPFSFSETLFEDFSGRYLLRSACWGYPARITWNA